MARRDRVGAKEPPAGQGGSIQVRLPPEELAALDAWIADQPDPKPTRGLAVRRLIAQALGAGTDASVPVEGLTSQNDV